LNLVLVTNISDNILLSLLLYLSL